MKQDTTLLANFLRTHREKAGFSQADVAQKLGYSTPQFVSNWERGISAPPFNALKKLAVLYSIDADALFNVVLENKLGEVTLDMKRKYYSL